ncbi:MAG: preprotein translocase subunit SecE, partial [Oscillospiraceae bacterium]|nr:preprotein translocase subunit SecE [Oscillospiraceae bacterium]
MAKKKKSPKTSSKNGQKKDVQEQKKDYNVSENEPKKDNKVVLNTKKADSENKGAKKSSKAKADKAEEKSGPKAWKSISQFFKDLRGETKKIVWTSRHDTIKGTGVVLL